MKVSEVVSLAQKSELRALAVAKDPEAIIQFINLGLLRLYNIFPLKTEEHIIELVEGMSIYDLPDDFMYITGAYESPPEVKHLSGVYGDAPRGADLNSLPLPINEANNPRSVNTVNFHQVQVPLTIQGAHVGLIYVQKPEWFTEDDLDKEVPLPDHLIQPLLYFIAFKGHGALRVDGQQSEGDVYYARFQRACDELKRQGTSIASDGLSMDSRLATRGFP